MGDEQYWHQESWYIPGGTEPWGNFQVAQRIQQIRRTDQIKYPDPCQRTSCYRFCVNQ